MGTIKVSNKGIPVININASRVPKFSKRMLDGLLLWSVFSIMTVDSDNLATCYTALCRVARCGFQV